MFETANFLANFWLALSLLCLLFSLLPRHRPPRSTSPRFPLFPQVRVHRGEERGYRTHARRDFYELPQKYRSRTTSFKKPAGQKWTARARNKRQRDAKRFKKPNVFVFLRKRKCQCFVLCRNLYEQTGHL